MKSVSMYVNGHTLRTNPGHAGGGVVLSYDGKTRGENVALGIVTNHEAELEAVMLGLYQLNQPCDVTIYSCNQWLVNCGSGKWTPSSYPEQWLLVDGLSITHVVRFEWIKKGSHELLDRACMLANEAANQSAVEFSE